MPNWLTRIQERSSDVTICRLRSHTSVQDLGVYSDSYRLLTLNNHHARYNMCLCFSYPQPANARFMNKKKTVLSLRTQSIFKHK